MKIFHSIKAETEVSDPEISESEAEVSVLQEVGDLDKSVSEEIEKLQDELMLPVTTDIQKQDIQSKLEKLKRVKNEFDSKHKAKISELDLRRERLSSVYKELYRTYARYLSDAPQHSNLNIFNDFKISNIKEDLNIIKDRFLECVSNSSILENIFAEYESQGLPLKLYFREDLVKYERLKDKFLDLFLYMLREIQGIALNAKEWDPEKYKDIIDFDASLEEYKNLAREHYQTRRKKFLQSNMLEAIYMKRDAGYFNLFQQSDLSKGFWELDKEAKKIKALPNSRKEIESQKDNDMDMIKKAIKDGGVWQFSLGQEVVLDTDFGYVTASIEQLLPNSEYLVKNDTNLKDGIKVSEDQILDKNISI